MNEGIAISESSITGGERVWIGANATVMPGVNIGAHAIVSVGTILMRDVATELCRRRLARASGPQERPAPGESPSRRDPGRDGSPAEAAEYRRELTVNPVAEAGEGRSRTSFAVRG
jgi:carbonic anhydrase/acetyltransferase-like protein (isoleucine patch superfamily)